MIPKLGISVLCKSVNSDEEDHYYSERLKARFQANIDTGRSSVETPET
jgi:hypothetical protein